MQNRAARDSLWWLNKQTCSKSIPWKISTKEHSYFCGGVVLFVVYAPAEVIIFLSADTPRNRLGAGLLSNRLQNTTTGDLGEVKIYCNSHARKIRMHGKSVEPQEAHITEHQKTVESATLLKSKLEPIFGPIRHRRPLET